MARHAWFLVLALAGCGGAYGASDEPDASPPPMVDGGTAPPSVEGGVDARTDAPADGPTDAGADVVDATPPAVFVVRAAAGNDFACAFRNDGQMGCWGANDSGQLGDSTTAGHDSAKPVSGITTGVTAIATGDQHACAVVNGGAKCWGYNGFKQLGTAPGANGLVANDVTSLTSGVLALTAAAGHSCAIVTGGGVKCWGTTGGSGQLGDGNLNGESATPVDVTNLQSAVTAISTTGYSTCALAFGALMCWGANSNGQLGATTSGGSAAPSPIANLLTSGVTFVSGGAAAVDGNNASRHMCAVQDGAAKCWGLNSKGQLGNNSTSGGPTPVVVQGLGTGVAAVTANGYHSCALTVAGGVKCWGANDKGQLGNPVAVESHVPVDVTGLTSGVKAITAGGYHTCAVLAIGKVKCWGLNDVGQLGGGVTGGQSAMPVEVVGL